MSDQFTEVERWDDRTILVTSTLTDGSHVYAIRHATETGSCQKVWLRLDCRNESAARKLGAALWDAVGDSEVEGV